jgi:hypothetical protein
MSDVGSWEPDEPALSDVHRKILDVAIKAVRRGQVFLQENQDKIPVLVSKEAREVKIDFDCTSNIS